MTCKGRRLSAGVSLMLLISCIIALTRSIKYWLPSSTSQIQCGIFLVFLSSLLLTVGLRAYTADKRNDLIRSLLLSLSPVWFSLGACQILETVHSVTITAGNISFLSIFICALVISSSYAILSTVSQVNQVTLLSFILVLSNVLEIVSLYSDSDHTFSVASLSMLYAIIGVYIVTSEAIRYYKEESMENTVKHIPGNRMNSPESYALLNGVSGSHLLTLIPFLVLSIASDGNACQIGIPMTCGGIFQIIFGIPLLRYQASFQSFTSSLYGLTWSTLGSTLLIECWIEGAANLGLSKDIPPTILVILVCGLLFFLAAKYTINNMLFNFLFVLELIALLVTGYTGTFFAVIGWFLSLILIYSLFAHGFLMVSNKIKFPLGKYEMVLHELLSCVKRIYCCYRKGSVHPLEIVQEKIKVYIKENDIIGYTKYANIEMMGFLVNGCASAAYLLLKEKIFGIAWVIVPGSAIQFAVGCVCYSRGKSFESCVFLLYSMFWLISGTSRGLLGFITEKHFSLAFGPLSFLVVGIVLAGMSLTISKAWTLYLILMLLNPVIVILDLTSDDLSDQLEITLVVLFCLSGMYCFLSFATKEWWGVSLIPEGKPFVSIIYSNDNGAKKVVMSSSRQTSGVRQIANILNEGGIVGIPTDTVYILCAACKHPQAVERAYNTKRQAEDRPMSMWISKLTQLECARKEFGPLLWAFMEKVWPSSISCVIPKGDWLQMLGIGESAKYIGRADSIAVRLPDYTITTHLIDLVGPIAVTSANPSGEADTTHHTQVLARLGTQNCDGILCDGPSPENAASTVVDCRKINEHHLGFFRIGITPKSSVEELFEEVLQKMQPKQSGAFQRVFDDNVLHQSVTGVNSYSPESRPPLGTIPLLPVSSSKTYNTYENTNPTSHISLVQVHGNPALEGINPSASIRKSKGKSSKKRNRVDYQVKCTNHDSTDSSGIGSSDSRCHDNGGFDLGTEKDNITDTQ